MSTKEVKSLSEVMKDLEKQYGKGTVLHGGTSLEDVEVISTGLIGLDHKLGIGGIAHGKVYEMFGWESSGKSTLCQTIVGNFQKAGQKCIYVDAENSVDREYAEKLGMDVDDLFIIQMDEFGGEAAYNKVEKMVETGEIGLVIYDSYNALQPLSVLRGEVGDSALGKHARMLGQAVMKANYLATKYGTTFIFIGQLREKIGVMFGSPQTTQGGNALRFFAHVRMEIVRSISKDNSVMDGEVKLGNQVTINVIKNKMGAPFTKTKINVMYGIGFDKIQEIIDLGKEMEIIKVRAGVITYEDTKYAEKDFKDLLNDNAEFSEKIRATILDKLSILEMTEKQEVKNANI